MASFEETSIGFKAIFQKTFNDTKAEAEVLATKVPSNNLSEKYAWLGNFPNMKEWVGERDVKQFADFGYALENKLFEASVTVPNTHIEYDSVGLYKPAIEQMAVNAKFFGSELVATVLLGGKTGLCYDGKTFFASDHVIGTDTYSNDGAGVLNSANLLVGKAFMMGIKNSGGKSLRVNPNTIVCGPSNLANVVTAIDKANSTSGDTNPTYKMFEYMVLPEITTSEWFMLDTTKPLKPFILQVAKDGVFEASNDDKFMKDHALFGTKSFMNAGYGLWQLAQRFSGVA
jgi:phage major head subunit gpT-like protein